MNLIEKLFREHRRKDMEKAVRMSHFIMARTSDGPKQEKGRDIPYHHIRFRWGITGEPFDTGIWDMTTVETMKIKKCMAWLEDYAFREIKRFRSEKIKHTAEDAMLPPWMVFPAYPGCSIHWRMGGGQEYHIAYWQMWSGLSGMEKKKYRRLYPVPAYAKYLADFRWGKCIE